MGFRSNFITEDNGVEWPAWFVEKYDNVHFINYVDHACKQVNKGKAYGSISSMYECKRYRSLINLESDIQSVLNDKNNISINKMILIWLHECGGVEKVEIYKDKIMHAKPTQWRMIEDGDEQSCDSYDCAGCSNLNDIEIQNDLINKINKENIAAKNNANIIESLNDLTRELASLTSYNDKFAKQRRKYLKRQIKLFEDTIKNKLIEY